MTNIRVSKKNGVDGKMGHENMKRVDMDLLDPRRKCTYPRYLSDFILAIY